MANAQWGCIPTIMGYMVPGMQNVAERAAGDRMRERYQNKPVRVYIHEGRRLSPREGIVKSVSDPSVAGPASETYYPIWIQFSDGENIHQSYTEAELQRLAG